jgi:hypothetical protein
LTYHKLSRYCWRVMAHDRSLFILEERLLSNGAAACTIRSSPERCMAFVRGELSWGDSVGCKRACLLGRVEGRDSRNSTRTGRELGLLLLRRVGEICRASTCHKSSLSWLEKTIRRSVCCSLRCCKKKQGGRVKCALAQVGRWISRFPAHARGEKCCRL